MPNADFVAVRAAAGTAEVWPSAGSTSAGGSIAASHIRPALRTVRESPWCCGRHAIFNETVEWHFDCGKFDLPTLAAACPANETNVFGAICSTSVSNHKAT